MNLAYRWFLGYLLNEPVPRFATISYNFRHRFTEDTIEKVFTWILYEAQKSGYLSPEVVFLDGTHIKANANLNKKVKKAIPAAARTYEKQLMEEINEDRKAHGRSRLTAVSAAGQESQKRSRYPQPIRRAGIQKPELPMREMSNQKSVYRKRELSKGSDASYLGGLYRPGRGYPSFSGGKRKL